MTRIHKTLPWMLLCLVMITLKQYPVQGYDPTDKEIPNIVPPKGTFEAFYPREMYGVKNGNSRPAHAHGSFYAHRNPALVEVRNAAAYGFRFDGKRRFNFD
uniref:Secreted protein n=1 Tax=Anopheles minimus TaxID=112268 RepID=A0A182VXI4_9DIPT